jgi:hypothetical protein
MKLPGRTHDVDPETRRRIAKEAKAARAASKEKQGELATSKHARDARRALGNQIGLANYRKQVMKLEEYVRGEIGALLEHDKPVIAGPFLGEVGFELLYWIPLLRWAVREFPGLGERLVIVSRGGSQHWYGAIGSRYVDTFDLWSVEEFHSVRGVVDKQMEEWVVERDLQARLRVYSGLDEAVVLHPSLLYTLYYLARKIDQRTFPQQVVHDEGRTTGLMAIYESMPPPDLGELARRLPGEYVAVRLYSRPSMPDSPETRLFAEDLIRSLARNTKVVLLNNGLELDDHSDLVLELEDSVLAIDDLMEPNNNLHVQTVALSRARAFIGTYGGLSYLAPFLNVPSIGFSSLPGHAAPWHLDLAQRVFDGPRWGSLVTMRPQDLEYIRLITG